MSTDVLLSVRIAPSEIKRMLLKHFYGIDASFFVFLVIWDDRPYVLNYSLGDIF